MRILVKFTDHADSFQSGNIYMNTLGYFWKHGFENQADIMEGVGITTPIDTSNIHIPEMKGHILSNYSFRAEGYKYCNIFCMYSMNIEYEGLFARFDNTSKMNEFGKYAVIINDENEFYRRINKAAKEYKYLCGNVTYHRDSNNQHHVLLQSDKLFDLRDITTQTKRDSFDKCERFKYQSEWRLCLYHGAKSIEPYILYIGDISDISTRIKTKDFERMINSVIPKTKFVDSKEIFYGNIDRRELRKLYLELGENMARMFFAFG